MRQEGRLRRGRQLLQLHPLALQHLVLAGLKVKGERLQAADNVEIGAVKGVGHVMVLAEGQNGLKLCMEERLLVAMQQATKHMERSEVTKQTMKLPALVYSKGEALAWPD